LPRARNTNHNQSQREKPHLLKHHQLVKVKFDEFKEQKKELTPQLAERSGSHLITRVGNVVVLYRPKLEEKQPES
jgi:RNA-binding protein